jgi:hypothetical protein
MTKTAQQDPAADVAQPDTVEMEIERLIAQDVILTAREKALKRIKDPLRARLLVLLKSKGYQYRKTGEGKASCGESTRYTVSDVRKLVQLFMPHVPEEHLTFWAQACEALSVVFDQIKVDKAFWEAAKKSHIKISDAVFPVTTAKFGVAAHRTVAAKERQERIIEETKYEMEQRVETLARRMMERNRSES